MTRFYMFSIYIYIVAIRACVFQSSDPSCNVRAKSGKDRGMVDGPKTSLPLLLWPIIHWVDWQHVHLAGPEAAPPRALLTLIPSSYMYIYTHIHTHCRRNLTRSILLMHKLASWKIQALLRRAKFIITPWEFRRFKFSYLVASLMLIL